MASKTRIYEVQQRDGDSFLVEAKSLSRAREFVADKFIGNVIIADGKRIAILMGRGTKVESVPSEPATA